MKFCEKCDMRLYLVKQGHQCLYCNEITAFDPSKDEIVSTTFVRNKRDAADRPISKYLKYDCTQPRLFNMKCMNDQCNSNKATGAVPSEITYVETDAQKMEYIYVCCVCDASWRLKK